MTLPLFRRKFTNFRPRLDSIVRTSTRDLPQISNLVASLDSSKGIDLPLMCRMLFCMQWTPEEFAAVNVRFQGSTTLVYSTGSIITTGSRLYSQAVHDSHLCVLVIGQITKRVNTYDKKTKRIVKVRHVPLSRILKFSKIDISNIVGKAIMKPGDIVLDEIPALYPKNVRYTPSTFCGARMPLEKLTVLAFGSGNMVYLGLDHPYQFKESDRIIRKIVSGCKESSITRDDIRYHIWKDTLADSGCMDANVITIESTDVALTDTALPDTRRTRFEKRVLDDHSPMRYRHRYESSYQKHLSQVRTRDKCNFRRVNINDFVEKSRGKLLAISSGI